MTTLKEHQRAIGSYKGFFVYDEKAYSEQFEAYITKLNNLVEGTCQRWLENCEAGNGAPDDKSL